MHPALMIAVIEERDREVARRSKHAWKQRASTGRPPTVASPRPTARRMSAALARSLALFGY
jgi:hypothetical protein